MVRKKSTKNKSTQNSTGEVFYTYKYENRASDTKQRIVCCFKRRIGRVESQADTRHTGHTF